MASQITEEQQANDPNNNQNSVNTNRKRKPATMLRIRNENIADEQDDLGSISSTKMNILCRLDRFLRRWLPGYNYFRGGKLRSQINLDTDGTASLQDTTGNQVTSKNGQQQPPPQQPQPKKEVYLDTGIAKSEFCVKLENILKSQLHKQEQNILQDGV